MPQKVPSYIKGTTFSCLKISLNLISRFLTWTRKCRMNSIFIHPRNDFPIGTKQAPCKLWNRGRQEAMRDDVTVLSGLSGPATFLVVPQKYFSGKTEAFAVPFSVIWNARWSKKALYELTPSACLCPVTHHCVYFRTWDLHWVNINREQNLKSWQFAFASEVYLYLLNLNCFFSRKKKSTFSFLILLYRKLTAIFKTFYLAHQLVIFLFIIVFLYCPFP